MTPQHIIYPANDADHLVALCILMSELQLILTFQHLSDSEQ